MEIFRKSRSPFQEIWLKHRRGGHGVGPLIMPVGSDRTDFKCFIPPCIIPPAYQRTGRTRCSSPAILPQIWDALSSL